MARTESWIDTYLALRGRLSRLVLGIVPPKEVEDIVQETYVRVCQIENKDSIREPRSFLFRTARNLALDYVKRAENRLNQGTGDIDELDLADVGLDDATFAQVTSNEEFALFCDAVRNLPKQCRRAFVLKKVYGYTLREIAEEMGVGQPTVESHIVAGTKKCVQYLRDVESNSSVGDRTATRRAPLRRKGGS